jgi:hypothetical protein
VGQKNFPYRKNRDIKGYLLEVAVKKTRRAAMNRMNGMNRI